MIKYYHEYILFKCYYSFKMVLYKTQELCSANSNYEEIWEVWCPNIEYVKHKYPNANIGLVILHNPVLCHLFH
jgi:hypothetical protein